MCRTNEGPASGSRETGDREIREPLAAKELRGEFAGFTDPTATDLSILGRDVLDHFDVLISRRRNEILLLAPRHRYRIESR